MSSVSSSSVFVPITDKSLHQMKMRTFYLNSRTDAGRRNEIEWRLEQAGLEARRFAVPAWEDVERVMKRRQEARRLLNGLAQDAPATVAAAEEGSDNGEHWRGAAPWRHGGISRNRRRRYPRCI
jgi:hypothetical protein